MLNFNDARGGIDSILTNLAQGYQPQTPELAPFILPSVPVSLRSGQIVRFGKEQFAIGDHRRAPGTNIPFVSSRFDTTPYVLEQESLAYEIPVEILEEAGNGPMQIDLRAMEVKNLVARLQNSYEKVVADVVTNTSVYEPGLAFATHTAFATAAGTGTTPWDTSTALTIKDVTKLSRLVSDHIAVRANSMVIGQNVYDELMTSADILDRIKYTSTNSIDTDMLARYYGMTRGLMVATGRYLAPSGKLLPTFPPNGVLVFYSPGSATSGLMPLGGASNATPAFGYTYLLKGYPNMEPEYLIKERRVVRAELTIERAPQLVALGETGLVAGGALIRDIFA
jgi:hypothetical protein